MLRYICTVFDANGNILRVEPFDAANDDTARDQGIIFQLTTSKGAGFEVWTGMRKVAWYYGTRAAWSTRPRTAETPDVSLSAVARKSRKRVSAAVH